MCLSCAGLAERKQNVSRTQDERKQVLVLKGSDLSDLFVFLHPFEISMIMGVQ